MCFFKYIFLLPLGIFALEIQRDFHDSFIFTDKVVNMNKIPCKNDILFMPEKSSFFGEAETPGVPYRTYVIAIPNSTPPSVQIENLKSETLSGNPCGERAHSLKIGEPYLKDNLWRVKVNVPLVYSTGASWNVRKYFRVKINFNGSASGYSVSKRALMTIDNKAGANKFGIKQIASRPAVLKKPGAGIDWLLRIGIGTTDLSASADGMYALPFDSLKKAMKAIGKENEIYGIKISELRIFGAPPDTLPELVGEKVFPNIHEIPIQVKQGKSGSSDIFDSGDSIVFFGYGTSLWKRSNSESGMDYYFSHSPYSFYQYFYLGANGTGKELKYNKKSSNGARDIEWKKYARSEKDLLLRDHFFPDNDLEENTGKEWFWSWGKSSVSDFQESVKNLNGLVGDSIWIGVSFIPRRSVSGSPEFSSKPFKERMKDIKFNFSFQNQQLLDASIKDTILGGTFVFASRGARKGTDNSYKLDVSSGSQNDRFDGLSVAYKYDPLSSKGDEWLFPGKESGTIRIPVPNDMELVKMENFIPMGIIEADGNYASDEILQNSDVKYFLHKKNSYKKPNFIEAIPSRHSVSNPFDIPKKTEYIILTSETMRNEALKLKEFRNSGLAPVKYETEVVLVEDIYMYHGAQPSPVAIRDFLRYAKDNYDVRYVLLAGNGHYDYRKIRQGLKSNIIPPYEAEDMSTDDFFAILGEGENVRFGKYDLALAIGRIPVSNTMEFDNYVQKAKDYETVKTMDNGIWRNTIIFNADDAMQGSVIDKVPGHTTQMEQTAKLVNSLSQEQGFAMELRKIPLLQYEKDGNNRKPEAAKELQLRLNQGALFTFYYGHGGAAQWADEDLLNTGSLSGLSNKDRYTILGSFSCMVARFDDVAATSLSEAFVTAKSKGAIASIGALRMSFPFYNQNLAEKILSQALFTENISSIGEAFLEAKKQTPSLSYSALRYNNERYALLGEPVLSMPRQEIMLKLNDVPDTIQALQKLKISGTALTQTGIVRMQVLEGEKQRSLSQSLGNGEFYTANIKIAGSTIYNEELKITNGKFETEFITPRKLSLGDTSAQIRLWVYQPGEGKIGRMAKNGITLFGTSPDAALIKDYSPPSIKIYPCMRSGIAAPFEENARVSLEIPACLDIVIEDSTGIDYREEADEGISFEVVGTPPWHPWPFSEQTGRRAVARMNFTNSYETGEYVFKVHAQDILGNTAVRSMRISLNRENKEGLADVFNIPNPMKRNGTTFYFKDLSGDRPGRPNNIRIKIFDQNGKLVKIIDNAISGVTRWDGKDSKGKMLANGLYHYVVQNTVQPLAENGSKKTFEKKQKLVISR